MKPIKESVLYKTSAATDVQCSGGTISLTGLRTGINQRSVSSIKQIKYRAEVVQVVTIGAVSYTPAQYVTYKVQVFDPFRVYAGYQENEKEYAYTLGAAYTGTAATDRETIHAALVTKINADSSNHSVALSLGTGTGFTVTDDGGYYPVFAQNMTNVKGINLVRPVSMPDGSGFLPTNYSITTAGVYSYGVGADLLAQKPVMDFVHGNLISGYMQGAPLATDGTGAVSGQKYDGFVIESMQSAEVVGITGQYAYVDRVSYIFVDNGAGTATTNLAGFKAFARAMRKLAVNVFKNDPSLTQEWFDKPIVFQDPLGAAPTGTADTLGWQLSPYGSLNRTNINTQTIVVPVLSSTGLLLDQDDTATDGSHTSSNQQTLGDQSFIVGKTAFMACATVVMGDWTDSAFKLGFRKKAVYGAVINNYSDYATVGNGSSAAGTTWINGDLIVTQGNINSGTPVQAISAVAPVDAVSVLLVLKVALDGTVSAFVDGVSYPIYSVGTTTLIFDAGDEMISFYQHVNIGSGDPAVTISEFWSVATDQLIQ